ncbi:MAG: type VI secretion system baseplate subunit TssE [Shimia sp.]
MDVFRLSFEDNDARQGAMSTEDTGGRNTIAEISARSKARRVGVDESVLRAHVRDHLATLMNCVRLDAIENLDVHPAVKASVVNYGFQDLSSLSREEITSRRIASSIRQSLVDHEPRLVPTSIHVEVRTAGDIQQRVGVFVSADLIADPADIPIEFEADVDPDGGTVSLSSQRI